MIVTVVELKADLPVIKMHTPRKSLLLLLLRDRGRGLGINGLGHARVVAEFLLGTNAKNTRTPYRFRLALVQVRSGVHRRKGR